MTDNRYTLHLQARRTGKCAVCGWKDGDGVQVCFYSETLGTVTHQNSEDAVLATMTPAQQSLYQLRQRLLYADAASREQALQALAASRPDDHEFLADYRRRAEAEPLATDEPYCNWIQEPWRHGKVHCYEPHECGGKQVFVEPYHFACSGCDTHVRLWEHGVDYDLG